MEEVRLHIGGKQVRQGWQIVNIQQGPHVDFVADAANLSWVADNSVAEVYASHVLEHLPWQGVVKALAEWHRVLKPNGKLCVAVPDIGTVARMLDSPYLSTVGVHHLLKLIYGGQVDEHDIHRAGFVQETLEQLLEQAGFFEIKRVASFGMFQDCSEIQFFGVPVSLNLEAHK
jgi:predicted SAM-dependent methyltransferase